MVLSLYYGDKAFSFPVIDIFNRVWYNIDIEQALGLFVRIGIYRRSSNGDVAR